MAGIDKTYCTLEEYKIVREWWLKTRDEQIRDLGHMIWLSPMWVYTENEQYLYVEDIPISELEKEKDVEKWNDPQQALPIWNTSVKQDLWLAINCNIDFIQDRLREQYNDQWIGFTHTGQIDFKDQPFIAEILLDKGDPIYFFKEHDDGTSEPITKVLFYGTTYLLKIFHQAVRTLYLQFETSDIKYIIFNYYGISVKYDQKKFIDIKTGEEIGVTIYDQEIIQPEFRHSYHIDDHIGYDDEEIFMSYENTAFDITRYKLYNRKNLKRYIRFLPTYVKDYIQT